MFTIDRIEVFKQDIRLWRDVTQKQPTEIRGWTTLASLYRDEGDLEKSTHVLRDAERYHNNHPKLQLAHGMNALREGRLDQAETFFREAWYTDQSLREAGNNLAWIMQKRDVEESIAIAKDMTTTHPLYATGWDTLGNGCLIAKDWTCARSAFDRALNIAPYRVDTHANLGSLYYLQEDWEQAKYWWTETLTLNPSHTYAQQGLHAIHKITAGDHPIEP